MGEVAMNKQYDTGNQYVRDLPCGLSVYVGFCQRNKVWRWSVEDDGEEVDERGVAESYEEGVKAARDVARKLVRASLKELIR